MSKFFAMGVQFVKEKTGASTSEINPAYEDASQRFDLLKERVKVLITDLTDVLRAFPAVMRNGVMVSEAASSAVYLAGSEPLPINESLTQIFTQISNIMNMEPFNKVDSIVLNNTLKIKREIDSIEKIRENRRMNQLLCDSAHDELNAAIKKGYKDKISNKTVKYEELKLKVNQITEEFIKQVDLLSEKQYEIIEDPIVKLTAIGFALLKQSVANF